LNVRASSLLFRTSPALLRGACLASVVAAALLVGCAPGPMTAASCSALPAFQNHRAPDAIAVPLRFENRMSAAFDVIETCIRIDDASVRQDDVAAVTAGFAAHRSLDLRPLLRPGVSHRVSVVATFAGRGALQGYRFSVTSAHDIGPAGVPSGALVAQFVERSNVPAEQRPTVEWVDPAAVSAGSVAAAPAPAGPATTEPVSEMTYEAAISAAGDEGHGVPLTDAELREPMRNATFVSGCGAPADMKVTVRVAVLDGHAYAVSTSTAPAAPDIARCAALAVRRLGWPSTAHRDFFTVTY
jgi:hypothetical protein